MRPKLTPPGKCFSCDGPHPATSSYLLRQRRQDLLSGLSILSSGKPKYRQLVIFLLCHNVVSGQLFTKREIQRQCPNRHFRPACLKCFMHFWNTIRLTDFFHWTSFSSRLHFPSNGLNQLQPDQRRWNQPYWWMCVINSLFSKFNKNRNAISQLLYKHTNPIWMRYNTSKHRH